MVRTHDHHYQAILFPSSKVLQNVLLAGSFVGAVIVTIMLMHGVLDLDLIKAIFGDIALWVLFFGCLISKLRGLGGIFLIPDGILWRGLLGGRCFIPWEAVGRNGLFLQPREDPHPVTNFVLKKTLNDKLVFGLDITDMDIVEAGRFSRKILSYSKEKHDLHLEFEGESLAAPLVLVARTVKFYQDNIRL